MINDDIFDAAERQRGEIARAAFQAEQDAQFLPRLLWIFETRGAAYVSAKLDKIERSFPPGFIYRHVRVEHPGTHYQRVRLRCDLREAA
ncbi:hypothetical protein [Methylobacterium oxalidis]|uniref:hypothetical protein n=1 Tax=Methylobacterium oxalidis TaxID=944322 RepID=UPI003314691F